MGILNAILLLAVLVCAVGVSLTKNLLSAVIIFMTQSLVMCIIWILLESPDLAMTEAAVGAGVTSMLMFAALKRIHALDDKERDDDDEE